jgi:hypothetical protein
MENLADRRAKLGVSVWHLACFANWLPLGLPHGKELDHDLDLPGLGFRV